MTKNVMNCFESSVRVLFHYITLEYIYYFIIFSHFISTTYIEINDSSNNNDPNSNTIYN